jgi:hypothetical protein
LSDRICEPGAAAVGGTRPAADRLRPDRRPVDGSGPVHAAGAGEAPGRPVTGHVGDANPLAAIQDALHLYGYDEIILSTLPWRLSRWMRIDLPSNVSDLGVPMLHVADWQRADIRIAGIHLCSFVGGPLTRSASADLHCHPAGADRQSRPPARPGSGGYEAEISATTRCAI